MVFVVYPLGGCKIKYAALRDASVYVFIYPLFAVSGSGYKQ